MLSSHIKLKLLSFSLFIILSAPSIANSIVINEIHYDENDKTLRAEFIELYNNGEESVDMSLWYFSDGIDYTFKEGTTLQPGAYLVVAENPEIIDELFKYSDALGPFANNTSLKNSGEKIVLRDAEGNRIDQVDYSLGFPWPTVGDLRGTNDSSPSIELINPSLNNNLGGSWRASGFPVTTATVAGGPKKFISSGNVWEYLDNDSDLTGSDWAKDANNKDNWKSGPSQLGYNEGDEATLVGDGDDDFTTAPRAITTYFRKTIEVSQVDGFSSMLFRLVRDDGAVVYVNGIEAFRDSMPEGPINAETLASRSQGGSNERNFFEHSVSPSLFVNGTNVIAVEVHQRSGNSSDMSFDLELIGEVDGEISNAGPTPGTRNRSYSLKAPPQIRQVNHRPANRELERDETIFSTEDVLISAKITDDEGIDQVQLEYQIVEPGDYIEIEDPRYKNQWTALKMLDDGANGDIEAADDVYTVKMPKSLQKNRHLVRYRILATDTTGISIRGPYDDDMGHNFAYFVYDGTPDWSGSVRRNGSKITFPGSLMSSIPTYFLLTKASSVTGSQFGGYGGAEYKWKGTMVYDGKVYDHIRYRPRGGVHRYQYGKNFWKFDFNRGRRFQARDRGGNKYKTKWDKLNFSSIVQQVNFGHRGEQGLFESVGFKLFELCGVEACKTHYLQFYVIDDESPTGSDQYSTDYYGLYLAIEQMDGQFLDQNGMPDGNLYKIEGHSGTSNNQGPTQVTNRSDVTNFIRGYRNQNPSADWWRENLDVDKYLSYRVIVEGIHHYDIAYGKNYYYYHNPETNKFQVHPWDLDLTWANNMYGNGNHDFKNKVANNSAFRTDYRNRVREIMDLIYNDDEGYKLIDEMAHDVWSPEGPTLVEADRRLWDNHPRLNHKDRYYDISPTRDFAGMKEVLRRYIISRGNWMRTSLLQDRNSTPEKPTITYIGGDDYQVDDLKFSSSSYRSQSNSRFAAMEWRLAEVYNPTVEGYVEKDPYIYEIENPAKSGELDKFEATYQFLPTDARVDRTYRARVRHKDQSGRWSNWSDPIQFKVSNPDTSTYAASLRITEVNYHPIEATVAEQEKGWTASDFEYIEIQNISNEDLELTNLRFTKGIDFDFKPGSIIKTGEYLLIVRNRVALESRYGAGLPIAGEWEAGNKLDNAGENIKLSFGAGTPIIEVTYDDKEPWPISADGDGFTLNLTDPKNVSQENHGEANNWYSGVASPGSEGGNAALTFNIWASDNGLGPAATKTDDPDGDGIVNLMEYALSSNPIAISRGDLPQIAMQTLDLEDQPKEYITYSFTRQGQTSDLIYSVEVSEDLKKWEKGTAILESRTTNADGTIKEMWRSPMNSSAKTKWFFRLVVKG